MGEKGYWGGEGKKKGDQMSCYHPPVEVTITIEFRLTSGLCSKEGNPFHNVQVLEYRSCLCCAVSTRSSILFVFTFTLFSQRPNVGGCGFFQVRGILDLAALRR